MLETILVAVDASPQQSVILEQAAELAIATGAFIHVATVADVVSKPGMAVSGPSSGSINAQAHEADEVLRTACRRLFDKGVPCQTHALNGIVSDQIILLADELNAGMIVVGHRHLSWLQKLFENSVGHDLLEYAPCNVLIVRERAGNQ